MAEAVVLEPDEVVAAEAEEQKGPQEVPSVFSVTNRYLVGRADVSPPADDGSRIVRLYSGNGGAIVEANLSPQLCEFVATKLTEIEVIEEAEVVEDASPADQS